MSQRAEKTAGFPGVSPMPPGGLRRFYRAEAVLDDRGLAGSALLVGWGEGPLPRVLALGTAEEVAAHPGAPGAEPVNLPGHIILPGLVNAHTHLDLTHIGPRPHDPAAGFLPWIDMIRASRRHDAEGVAESVRRGIELALAGGTVAVGDIAGGLPGEAGLAALCTLRESPLLGVCFFEIFGIGNRRQAGLDRLEAIAGELVEPPSHALRPGIQPHAPYSVDRRVYAEAIRLARQTGAPLATHLAESQEEDALVRDATGPFRELLERLGIWDDSVNDHLGRGEHPVRHLEAVLGEAPFLVAHVNDASGATIEILARTGSSVAYCPRASGYFGAPDIFGPHRYQEMLAAGVNVALGTDSIVNLPETPQRLSVWDEMRLLDRRDRTDPLTLLAMATVNGARALRMPDAWLRFQTGAELAGAIAVPLASRVDLPAKPPGAAARAALASALRAGNPPRLLFTRNYSYATGEAAASGSSTLVIPQ